MKALLLQLEFPTWKTARPWTYGASFAVSDGLAANGVTCVTVPIIPDAAASSPDSWLSHARRILAGERFDQVWIWLVHASLDVQILEWVAELAPVRIGFFMESLRYEEEDYRWAPELRNRHIVFHHQLEYLTHALLVDERDVAELTALGTTPALWCPGLVPRRFIADIPHDPRHNRAVFHGNVYGERARWIEHPLLRERMTFANAPVQYTPNQRKFDELQSISSERVRHLPLVTAVDLERYVRALHTVREGEFHDWLSGLADWAGIVNLPGLTRCFGGRVYEAMAVGRPVISWRIPDRPRVNALFEDNREILLFSPDDPSALAHQIDRILTDKQFARTIGSQGQRKVHTYHTAERRMQQVLEWIETGKEPDYGIAAEKQSTGACSSSPVVMPTVHKSESEAQVATTVFVLTVDDPVCAACLESLHKQEGTSFKLEVIRNVCPFSAAAQRMITGCATEFFIQVDEDMMLHLDAVASMEATIRQAPDDVGMICFHLFDDDRGLPIQGVKIYRTALMQSLAFRDIKASEMDLLEQMGRRGIQWILHPDVKGRHGTSYTVDSIYRRYKTMYEKDIRQWNVLTSDIRRKADAFRQTGDPLQLFALLGAAHGIICAPLAPDREKDARLYELAELDVFRRLFLSNPPLTQSYAAAREASPPVHRPIPFEQVQWKGEGDQSRMSTVVGCATKWENGSPTQSVLIVTPHFWPSIGGVECVAEELGVGLLAHGYHVDVAAYPHAGRHATTHRGVKVITLSPHDRQVGSVPACALEVERLIGSRQYDACVMLGAPVNPLFYGAMTRPLPDRTRLIVQPTLNKEICDLLSGMSQVKDLVIQLVAHAHQLVVLSKHGCDASFFGRHGLTATYLPNGIRAIQAKGAFREEHGIAPDAFIILHVANLYPVKNHLGLLQAFATMPQGAKLVLVGHQTDDTGYVEQVRQALAGRPEVLYIPGLSPEGVAAAMQAANVLVVPSHAEASPLCILEAMSHRLPWMATPECDAAHEQAGGVVLPLDSFKRAVVRLMQEPTLCRALGETGYAHWEACHQWSAVLEGWIELIETGRLSRSYTMPADVAERTTAQRQAFAGQLARVRLGASETTTAGNGQSVSDVVGQTNGGGMHSDTFYKNLFVNSPMWSTPHPNADEASRWSKIAAFLEYILRRVREQGPNKQLRILDIGCGRGWLTNLATMYGTCEGIEPVAAVVEHARKLFPHLRFEVGTAESVLSRSDFAPYDVVLTSEVIEHVPHGQKEAFLAQLAQLLRPDGYLILTTPRGEMWEQWKRIAPPNQPVEDWVTEDQLRALFVSQGFSELGLERVHVEPSSLRYIPAPTPADLRSMNLLPIYQVWVCQRTADPRPIPFTRAPKVSVIVPTYNRPERLKTALASLAAQTYQDFEVVVVNDAGCEVGAVIDACADRHRITIIRHDRNRGLAAARNSGLRAAKGTYIAYLDDDDRYLPNHLETLVAYLDRHECRVAYTDAWRVHERQVDGGYVETARDVPYSNEFSPVDLLISNYFPVLCVMHARQCLDEVGGFDESLFAHEDWDLWIRMATRFPFKHLAVRTAEFTWRSDGSSMTSRTRDTYKRTTEIIYRKYAPYAEGNAAIREAQQRHLQKFQAEASVKSCACSIIIPVWNRCELTRQCIEALAKTTDDISWELIVVDNHSTDDTASFLSTLGGDIQVITNQENLGFAKACNQGARAAHGKYLVFLNNDTIPQPGWLPPLVSEVDAHSDVGIVGSKLLYPDGTVQHAGVVFMRSRVIPYHIYRAAPSTMSAVNQRREFQAVTAACMLIRREVFEKVKGFDECFINGFEDVDLCLKVREQGHHVIYQPRSVVYHLESQTSGRSDRDEQNARLLGERWGDHWWIEDADFYYHIDGFKLVGGPQDEKFATDVKPLIDICDRAAWAHVAAVQAAAVKKDWESVKRELGLVENWPNDRFVLSWGAMVAERLQEPISRTKFLSRYLALVDAPAERAALIRTLLEQKNLAGAEEHLRTLLASSPNHAEGLLMKGVLCMQREQYESAEAAFESALRGGANRKKCLMGMGMASLGRAYTQGAWERFLQVLEEFPDDAEAIHWLLRAGTGQNRWGELSRHLRKYLSRNPADLAIRFALAGVLVRGEEVEAARQEYDTLRTLAPTYDGLIELGQAIAAKQAVPMMEAAHS
ncbi:MAG: glycosyltransferase [Nitrospira sp.]|nr:glycosyltransferase [Nitrospira sp.]